MEESTGKVNVYFPNIYEARATVWLILVTAFLPACSYKNHMKVCVYDPLEEIRKLEFTACEEFVQLSTSERYLWESSDNFTIRNCEELVANIGTESWGDLSLSFSFSPWPFENEMTQNYTLVIHDSGSPYLRYDSFVENELSSCKNPEE
ncbi:hypothetical protein AB6B39_13655 [Algimonas porphyrae]|uniref:hypothetical protein n=1 Tax=Algimonas porphyrae TaxID=1128113 RepID=UPI00352A4FF7